MENYKKLVSDLIEQNIEEYITWNEGATRADAVKHMDVNGFDNLFGNIDGSRTCSTYEAQKFIDEAGAIWDEEIRELFDEMGDDYFTETLKRGAEVFDVVICELVANGVLYEIASAEGVEL